MLCYWCYHVPHFDGDGAALYFVHIESHCRHQPVTEAARIDNMNERRLNRNKGQTKQVALVSCFGLSGGQ